MTYKHITNHYPHQKMKVNYAFLHGKITFKKKATKEISIVDNAATDEGQP